MPASEITVGYQTYVWCRTCETVTTCGTCIDYGRCHVCRTSIQYLSLTGSEWDMINDQLENDVDDTRLDDMLMNYSAEPHGGWQPRGDGKLFFGIELEVTCHSRKALRNAMQNVGDLCIFKHDGSVAGFEMVTQPMSYEYAMTEFPWTALPQMEDDGCTIYPADNGLHIHVSRAGFNGDAHTYTWEKFLHKNRRHVNRIARRRNNNWCRWTESSDVNYFPDLMRRKIRGQYERLEQEFYRGRYYSDFYPPDAERARYYARRRQLSDMNDRFLGIDSPDRYSAINIANEDTIEVRCFASTLSPAAAQAALGLLHASIAYTGTVKAHDVIRSRAWAWENFHAYVFKHRETYPALMSVIDSAPVPYSASASF